MSDSIQFYKLVFFKNSDIATKRTEYHEAVSFYKATTDANQMATPGWSSESVRRLHPEEMSRAELLRFGLEPTVTVLSRLKP